VTRLRAKVGDLYVFSTGPSYGPEGAIVLSPGFFNPGTDHLGRRALKGRQIESTNNAEMGFNCGTSQLRTLICATIGCELITWSGILPPLQGETLIGWFPGLKSWAKGYSPFGASPGTEGTIDGKTRLSHSPPRENEGARRNKESAYSFACG
jgi:hypothetical protein